MERPLGSAIDQYRAEPFHSQDVTWPVGRTRSSRTSAGGT